MHAGLKITAFAAGLAATFGTAYGVGKGVGPVDEDPKPVARHESHSGASEGHGGDGGAVQAAAGGLQISEEYTNMIAGIWWTTVFPALAIATTVIAVNLIADALQSVLSE